ncbi:hypothetical protein GW932_03660 [archaeon]|nr:hypothetical protein [archaeon]
MAEDIDGPNYTQRSKQMSKEKYQKKRIGRVGAFIAGSLLTGYIVLGSLGEWKPWNYNQFFKGHNKIEVNYNGLFKDCKNKDDSTNLYQKFGLQDYIKLKDPPIDEKIRVLSESKLEKEVSDSLKK